MKNTTQKPEQLIVSRNFRDGASTRYLVRKEGQKPEQSIGVDNIELADVTFGRSTDAEEGFGCRVVAKGKGLYPYPKERKLVFDGGYHFHLDTKEGQVVEKVSVLKLGEEILCEV